MTPPEQESRPRLAALSAALSRALRRGGAFGSVYGGHAGKPEVGLLVPVRAASELPGVLDTLAGAGVKATLVVSPVLPVAIEALRALSAGGHELAGTGPLEGLAALEVGAGQPVTHWKVGWQVGGQGGTGGWADLRALAAGALRPLPAPTRTPAPGQVYEVAPADLSAELPRLKTLGFRPVPVRELPELRAATPRDLFQHAYRRVVEDRYAEQTGMIDLSMRYDAVMKVAALDHAPAPLPLPPGTPTAELHLNSARLVGLASLNWLGTYRAYQRSLRDVARALQSDPRLAQAQAVFAVTMFHGPLEKSGFRLLDLPPLRARWYALGFRLLRLAYGTTRAQSVDTPKMAWLPRDEFLKKYG